MPKKCLFKTLQGHCRNVFINLPLNNFCPLSLASISSYFSRSPRYKILSCIPRHYEEAKAKYVNWLSVGVEFRLTVRKPQLRLLRLSRGFSSCGGASWWCVAAVAAQVSVSGCSVKCDTPFSWGDAGKIGEGGGEDGVASPAGLSHTAAPLRTVSMRVLYGPFMELKCFHFVNYSLFLKHTKKYMLASNIECKKFNHRGEMSSAFIYVELHCIILCNVPLVVTS